MLKLFKVVSYAEGISYLVLFFNMLFIKPNQPELYHQLLYPIGMAHGFLFIAYVILAVYLKITLNWSFKKFFLIGIASLLPFGTFYSEAKWVNKEF